MSHLCTLSKGPAAVVAPTHVLCNPLLQPYLLFMKDGGEAAIRFNVKVLVFALMLLPPSKMSDS